MRPGSRLAIRTDVKPPPVRSARVLLPAHRLGLHFGLVLTHFADPEYRLKHWGVMSTVMFALGWIISPFWAMNKQLWSPA
jgi:hypothetical protein